MIELVANGVPDHLVSLTLTQDGNEVNINLNGSIIAYFRIKDGQVKLELCEGLYSADFAEKLHLNELGQIVAD